jgi:hypothetical protein
MKRSNKSTHCTRNSWPEWTLLLQMTVVDSLPHHESDRSPSINVSYCQKKGADTTNQFCIYMATQMLYKISALIQVHATLVFRELLYCH